MRKYWSYLIISCLISINTCFCQMDDGAYCYSNNDISLSFVLTDQGNIIRSATIIFYLYPGDLVLTGTGEWFEVNPNGVDKNYDGPFGWYQFQTTICNYTFEYPKDKGFLKLEQYDCTKRTWVKSYILYPCHKI